MNKKRINLSIIEKKLELFSPIFGGQKLFPTFQQAVERNFILEK
jgi:hypothetical protein